MTNYLEFVLEFLCRYVYSIIIDQYSAFNLGWFFNIFFHTVHELCHAIDRAIVYFLYT